MKNQKDIAGVIYDIRAFQTVTAKFEHITYRYVITLYRDSWGELLPTLSQICHCGTDGTVSYHGTMQNRGESVSNLEYATEGSVLGFCEDLSDAVYAYYPAYIEYWRNRCKNEAETPEEEDQYINLPSKDEVYDEFYVKFKNDNAHVKALKSRHDYDNGSWDKKDVVVNDIFQSLNPAEKVKPFSVEDVLSIFPEYGLYVNPMPLIEAIIKTTDPRLQVWIMEDMHNRKLFHVNMDDTRHTTLDCRNDDGVWYVNVYGELSLFSFVRSYSVYVFGDYPENLSVN